MIKLKITKIKLKAIVNAITAITNDLRTRIQLMKYDMGRAQANAHLYILDDLSRKIRSKLILIENYPETYRLTFSINEMQAYVIIIADNKIFTSSPYVMSIMSEVSDIIYKKLLN